MSKQFFPTICVDNFLTYPDTLREYALSLDYYVSSESEDETLPKGTWPGSRPLFLLGSKPLFLELCNKFLSLFLDKNFHNCKWNIQMHFQLCSPNQYGCINEGWIHHDGDTLYAGVLYLTPNAPLDTGTSLYEKRADCLDFDFNDFALLPNSKCDFYSNFDSTKIEEYEKMLKINNSNYEETVSFKNIYNRLICYSGNIYHGVKNYYGDDMTNDRLTLVFFINSLDSNWNSIQAMKKYNI